MNKRIATFLMALCLVWSLTACGGNAGVDDTPPPSNSIEPTETPSESIVDPSVAPSTEPPIEESTPTIEPTVESSVGTPTEPPTEEPTPTIKPTVEPSIEPTQSTDDGNTSTPTPITETKPSTPTVTTTPPQTVTQTPPPETVHTHSYSVTQNPTCTTEGLKTCSCGDTISISANGHTYTTQTIQGTGHMEQIQVGTNTVDEYEYVTVYECDNCKATTTDYYKMQEHQLMGGPCPFYGYMIRQKKQLVGVKEEPIYENQWVIDTPDTTIQVCSVCGAQQ